MFLQAFRTILITSAITTTFASPLSQRQASVTAEIFPAGNCAGNSINYFQPAAGSSSYGQCTNFAQGGNYGAFYIGPSNCIFKSWELPDCHGKATVHAPNGENCIPIGNKDNALYLTDGASSLSVECDGTPPPISTITITLPPTTITSTSTTTMTLTSVFRTGPPATTVTQVSETSGVVDNAGSFGGVAVGAPPGTPVQAQSVTEVRVDIQVDYFNDRGEVIDTDGMTDGEALTASEEAAVDGDANGVEEGAGGEEGEDTPQEHVD